MCFSKARARGVSRDTVRLFCFPLGLAEDACSECGGDLGKQDVVGGHQARSQSLALRPDGPLAKAEGHGSASVSHGPWLWVTLRRQQGCGPRSRFCKMPMWVLGAERCAAAEGSDPWRGVASLSLVVRRCSPHGLVKGDPEAGSLPGRHLSGLRRAFGGAGWVGVHNQPAALLIHGLSASRCPALSPHPVGTVGQGSGKRGALRPRGGTASTAGDTLEWTDAGVLGFEGVGVSFH